jgi:single-stranded-DNA-specific exonuclease
LIPRCRVDAVVAPSELDEGSVKALEMLGPFGCGNPEPVFVMRRQVATPRLLPSKREGGSNHLKLSLETAPHLDAIGFGMGDQAGLVEGPVDLAFQVSLDEWNGRRRVQLKLKDMNASA